MDEWQALGLFFQGIWQIFKTPMDLPWIGTTSPLSIMLFLSVTGILADFIAGLLGGGNNE